MVARARLLVRASGLVATVACTAAGALTLFAPSASATGNAMVVSTTPSGVGAKAAAIENASAGELLWSRGLNTERPIGSIAKVMTALVVLQAGDLNRTITIPSSVVSYVREHDASS